MADLYVSALSSMSFSFDQDLELWDELGVERVALYLDKLEAAGLDRPSVGGRSAKPPPPPPESDSLALAAAAEHVRAAGLSVSSIACRGFELYDPASWDERRAALDAAVDAATVVGARCLFVTAGVPGPLEWDDCVHALEAAIAPVRDRAQELGVPLAVENANPLRRDVGFAHTLPDTVELARRLGLQVVVEITNCWYERELHRTIADGVDAFAVVQMSDYVVGDATASERAVPGDGDIPLDRIIGCVLDAGYTGPFELEMLGPRIEAEGYRQAIPRALAALEPLLGKDS